MWLGFLKLFLLIAPDMWRMVRDGKVKGAAEDQVLAELMTRLESRFYKARMAREEEDDQDDPFDRG